MLFTKGKKIKKVKQEKNIKNNKKIAKKKETLFTKFQKKFNSLKVARPRTTPQIIRMFFKGFNEQNSIIQLDENLYSVCFEYQDISFSKANYDEQESIFLKWVEFLHSFNFNDHIQVMCAGRPIKTKDYKKDYIYSTEGLNDCERKVANEFNTLIETCLGNKEEILCETRQVVITTKAESMKEAQDLFFQYQLKTEEKFKELKSKIRRITIQERLESLYNVFHTTLLKDDGIDNIVKYAKDNNLSVYDVIAPKEDVSLKEKNYININNKKFIRVLYVSHLPKSITPRFYNRITTLDNCNIITTLNITPTDPAKAIKKVNKKISGMKTERLEKIKKANKNNYSYEAVKDEKLEDAIIDTQELRDALQKKKQKLFTNNVLICIQADSLEELEKNTKIVCDIGSEQSISIYKLDWQQLEGLQNCLAFGWNSLQIQRSLTSESTATNVPFNTKDLMQPKSIYHGINLVSKNPVFCDRKKLLNGNGCVLATSGAGKSFSVKLMIEQVLLRYPKDEVIVIDVQGEYAPLIKAFEGQTLNISTSSDTYINPFDSSLQYEKDEEALNSKIEFSLAFIESIVGGNGLTGEQKTLVDRCTKNIYEEYQLHNFDVNYEPDFIKFYNQLIKQPEKEAKNLALVIERYVLGGMGIFSRKTNVEIKNRFISFDISELPQSIQTTGYLVILEHIMNRLKRNKTLGKHTWIFIDEFHILLANQYSAEYIARIYKTGRKENAIPTIITQNIADIIKNEQGCKILSNSEFAMLLKQKPLDLPVICKIFDISDEEARYVIDSPAGQGLIVYGEDKVAFRNQVMKDSYIYQMNQTSNLQQKAT